MATVYTNSFASIQKEVHEMLIIYYYILYKGIFHKVCLFCWLNLACDTYQRTFTKLGFEKRIKLQKRICRTVGPSLSASLEPLAHRRNVASLKVVSATFSLVCFVCLKESTCETRKNVFYFTSIALSVLEIIRFSLFKYSNVMTSSNA